MRKIHSVLGRARYTDSYTDVYNVIACTRVMITRACANVRRCTSFPFCHKIVGLSVDCCLLFTSPSLLTSSFSVIFILVCVFFSVYFC